MKFEEYVPLAQRTSPEGHNRACNGILGLLGECGEVADLVKKWLFQSGDDAEFPKEKMIEETGDVMWYVAETAAGLGITDALASVIIKSNEPIKEDTDMNQIVAFAGKLCDSASKLEIMFRGSSYVDSRRWKNPPCPAAGHATLLLYGVVVELAYFVYYLCDSTLGEVMERNIEKLKKRYPDGFDPDRSVNRAAYEVADHE